MVLLRDQLMWSIILQISADMPQPSGAGNMVGHIQRDAAINAAFNWQSTANID